MILALKGIVFETYELMDRDALRIPEPGTPEFRRFMNDDDRLKRKIKEPVYIEWVTKFPGQSTYLCSQISFKQKIEAIFLGAAKRGNRLKMERETLEARKKGHGGMQNEEESSSESEDDESIDEDASIDWGDDDLMKPNT